MKTALYINALELAIHLGWPDEERREKQTVLVNIHIIFPNTLKACATDKLSDTICYSDLINMIREDIKNKTFHLLEYFTQHLYHFIKTHTQEAMVTVQVTKFPPIQGLTGGVQCSLGDIEK